MKSEKCENCAFYAGNQTCYAFDWIPVNIFSGEKQHSSVIKGQFGEFIHKHQSDHSAFDMIDEFIDPDKKYNCER